MRFLPVLLASLALAVPAAAEPDPSLIGGWNLLSRCGTFHRMDGEGSLDLAEDGSASYTGTPGARGRWTASPRSGTFSVELPPFSGTYGLRVSNDAGICVMSVGRSSWSDLSRSWFATHEPD